MAKGTIDEIVLPTFDNLEDLFTSQEQRDERKLEKIQNIPITQIKEFKNHPFKVREDEDMMKLIDSVKENGILVPTLVRPTKDGNGYEMISGHRRMKAAELNNMDTISAIVRDLTDDQAIIVMVDSNIQRENILPSERGFAYKMKLEAMKHQGKRVDLTCSQLGNKLIGKKSISLLADEIGESKNQIHRYIRLTELIEPLRDLVDGLREDGRKIALNPAVELSYLNEEQQMDVVKYIDEMELTPSHAQTIRMKDLARLDKLSDDVIYTIMSEEKPNQKEKLSFKMDEINKYFPRSYTPRQKSKVIMDLLEQWAKKRKREQQR